MTIQPEEIIKALPHRYPFLMVDRVLELVPGRKAVAIKTITASAPFSGRTGGPASLEMLVIESMAQVGALTYAFSKPGHVAPGEKDEPGMPVVEGYLAGLNDVIFHIRPSIGDTLELVLEYVAGMGALVRFRGTARIAGKTAVEAGLTFTVEERR